MKDNRFHEQPKAVNNKERSITFLIKEMRYTGEFKIRGTFTDMIWEVKMEQLDGLIH